MRAVVYEHTGGPEVLKTGDVETPVPKEGEVQIAVAAAGLSRADVWQRKGFYPPPPGASHILGLDVAGTISAVGDGVHGWRVGEAVCALLTGGGYAEYACAPAGQVLPLPEGWNAVEATTLPENGFTVFDNIVTRGRLAEGEWLLVHGGSSGIGTTAIMFAKALGARAIVTAGSAAKCAACIELGAVAAIDYKRQDFVEESLRITQGRGVDVVLDIVGGGYIPRDVAALAPDGRIACIATQGGTKADLDIGELMRKRGTIFGTSLRPRSAEQKKWIADALHARIWPLLPARNPIRPLVDRVFRFEQAAEAHRRMESSEHIGKIVLTPR